MTKVHTYCTCSSTETFTPILALFMQEILETQHIGSESATRALTFDTSILYAGPHSE